MPRPVYRKGSVLTRDSDGRKFKIVGHKQVKEIGRKVPITEYRLKAPNGYVFPCDRSHLEKYYSKRK